MSANVIEDDSEMDIPTFDSNGSSTQVVKNYSGHGFINHSAKPFKGSIKVLIDHNIVQRIRDLEYSVHTKLGGSNEFGGYLKYHWDDKGRILIDDFMIPEQVVGGATVDFKTTAPEGYNGVFHKHPTGCCGFSGVDDTYINSNNELSLLFENQRFLLGVVNIKLPGGARQQQSVDIVVTMPDRPRREVDVSMVRGQPKFRQSFHETVLLPDDDLPGLDEGVGGIQPDLFENDEDIEDDSNIPDMEEMDK